MPYIFRPGDSRMAVLSAPISCAMAVTTSMAKRARFSIEPAPCASEWMPGVAR